MIWCGTPEQTQKQTTTTAPKSALKLARVHGLTEEEDGGEDAVDGDRGGGDSGGVISLREEAVGRALDVARRVERARRRASGRAAK